MGIRLGCHLYFTFLLSLPVELSLYLYHHSLISIRMLEPLLQHLPSVLKPLLGTTRVLITSYFTDTALLQ